MTPDKQPALGENLHHIRKDVQAFYTSHPYPQPANELEIYQAKWQDENRRRVDFHLLWPGKTYRENLTILVAGCGTSQAAKSAIRNPAARVVGIDLSSTSIQHTLELKKKYNLENLSAYKLPIERAGELEYSFDKIVCTGVLHHLPEPLHGLRALADVLNPGGALHLMVYAPYGRYGVYMLQEYTRLMGVGDTIEEINDFANTLMSLPADHPLAPVLGSSPDFRTRAGLADALLNPKDRAYSVPELMELISAAEMRFGRWIRQAPYLPQCGRFADSPHAVRLTQLSMGGQYSAMELLRGTMLRHSAVIYHDSTKRDLPVFDCDQNQWLQYIPLRTPGSIYLQENLPEGAAAVLLNQAHTFSDLVLPIDETQLQIFNEIDGHTTIGKILKKVSSPASSEKIKDNACRFFQQLWWFDQVVLETSNAG